MKAIIVDKYRRWIPGVVTAEYIDIRWPETSQECEEGLMALCKEACNKGFGNIVFAEVPGQLAVAIIRLIGDLKIVRDNLGVSLWAVTYVPAEKKDGARMLSVLLPGDVLSRVEELIVFANPDANVTFGPEFDPNVVNRHIRVVVVESRNYDGLSHLERLV